jgi:hypothetical protein
VTTKNKKRTETSKTGKLKRKDYRKEKKKSKAK